MQTLKIIKTFIVPFIPALAAVAVMLTLQYVANIPIETPRFWYTWVILTGCYVAVKYIK